MESNPLRLRNGLLNRLSLKNGLGFESPALRFYLYTKEIVMGKQRKNKKMSVVSNGNQERL